MTVMMGALTIHECIMYLWGSGTISSAKCISSTTLNFNNLH